MKKRPKLQFVEKHYNTHDNKRAINAGTTEYSTKQCRAKEDQRDHVSLQKTLPYIQLHTFVFF